MESIKELTTYIKSPVVRDLTEDILEKYNPMLFKIFAKASSSSGKYHPAASNGDFGLMHHTKVTILAANRLIDLYKPMNLINDLNADIIRSAIVLHDAWKYIDFTKKTKDDVPSETVIIFEDGKIDLKNVLPHTTKTHGYVGYLLISEYMHNRHEDLDKGQAYVLTKVAEAVRYHMSNWCHNADEIKGARSTRSIINRIVQEADMISSCKPLLDYKG